MDEPPRTLHTDGDRILDPCGERLVMRGVNKGIAFPGDRDAARMPEVAKTGANTVRTTHRYKFGESDEAEIDRVLTTAWENHMFVMPCTWDATGNWAMLDFASEFWLTPEMIRVLRKHEAYTLLNIANEAGNRDVTNEQYRAKYTEIIHELRSAGLRLPLVVDAAHWGRGENYIQDNAEYLLEQDPERNLIFSWHPWDTNQEQSRYSETMDWSVDKAIPLVIGEFAWKGVSHKRSIDYEFIMSYAEQKQIGWLYWWWYTKNADDSHRLTSDGNYGSWVNAANEVILGETGIQETSERTYFQEHGVCETPLPEPSLPQAPTGVSGVASGARVDLSWNDIAGDELAYDIEVREAGSEWRLVKVVRRNSTSATIGAAMTHMLYDDDTPYDLKYDTEYEIRVGAYKAAGVTAWSEPITVKTESDPSTCAGGSGLTGRYYYTEDHPQDFAKYDEPLLTRVDPVIDFDWDRESPHSSIPSADHFQIRWTGTVEPQLTTTYTFYTDSDEFARLWVNGQQLIDNWRANAKGWAMGSIELQAGEAVDIVVEYREWDKDAHMHLYWAAPELERQVIPSCRLYPE